MPRTYRSLIIAMLFCCRFIARASILSCRALIGSVHFLRTGRSRAAGRMHSLSRSCARPINGEGRAKSYRPALGLKTEPAAFRPPERTRILGSPNAPATLYRVFSGPDIRLHLTRAIEHYEALRISTGRGGGRRSTAGHPARPGKSFTHTVQRALPPGAGPAIRRPCVCAAHDWLRTQTRAAVERRAAEPALNGWVDSGPVTDSAHRAKTQVEHERIIELRRI
jgi:hypothetical protein